MIAEPRAESGHDPAGLCLRCRYRRMNAWTFHTGHSANAFRRIACARASRKHFGILFQSASHPTGSNTLCSLAMPDDSQEIKPGDDISTVCPWVEAIDREN